MKIFTFFANLFAGIFFNSRAKFPGFRCVTVQGPLS